MLLASHFVGLAYKTATQAGALRTISRRIAFERRFDSSTCDSASAQSAIQCDDNLAHPAGRKNVRHNPSVRSLVNQPRKQLRLVHAPSAPTEGRCGFGIGALDLRSDLGHAKLLDNNLENQARALPPSCGSCDPTAAFGSVAKAYENQPKTSHR